MAITICSNSWVGSEKVQGLLHSIIPQVTLSDASARNASVRQQLWKIIRISICFIFLYPNEQTVVFLYYTCFTHEFHEALSVIFFKQTQISVFECSGRVKWVLFCLAASLPDSILTCEGCKLPGVSKLQGADCSQSYQFTALHSCYQLLPT